MGKKSAIISVIVLVTGLAVLGYFLRQGRKSMLTDPWKAVTPNASVIIESPDLKSFINALTTGQGLFGEIAGIEKFGSFNRKLKFLADQLNNPVYQNILDGSRALVSFHVAGDGKFLPLLVLAVRSETRYGQLKDALKSSGIKTGGDILLAGVKTLVLPYDDQGMKDSLLAANVSGLILFTPSEELMRNAIIQAGNDGDVRTMPGFQRILQASGKNEDKIFIVYPNLSPLLEPAFRPGQEVSAGKAGRIAGSSGYDIHISNNGFILSGYTESTDSGDILHKYKSGSVKAFSNYRVLPSATVLFESVLYDTGQNDTGQNDIRQGRAGNTGSVPAPAAELSEALREYTGDEITRALIDIRSKPEGLSQVIIYELKNRAYAEKVFLDKFSSSIRAGDILFFRPDDQISIPVYLTPYKGYASAFLENYSGEFHDSCFAFYDNYLVTGNSYSVVSRFLYDNLLNKTLANDLVYRDFESSLPSMSKYLFYCVPSRISGYLSDFLSDEIMSIIMESRISLGKIPAAGFQLTPSNEMIYNCFSIRFREDVREEPATEWETLLDTVAAVKPFFFRNHITGATEIFIQDLRNNAYLINTAGRILWKVPLQERINGTVYMIDYYRNGKFQLLFSGRNHLHLLDRNGNYVERYPVRLRSPATNPPVLFDYDNNRNYRIFIAGEDRMIYSYDKSGNAVKGWKPFRTGSTVNSEVMWFRVSGKDYLVVADENSVYFLDRTGNVRTRLREAVTKARGSSMRLLPGRIPVVVCSSPDGTIQHMHFDGSVEKFRVRDFSPEHCFDIFDVDGDGSAEYIFIDEGVLYLYGHDRSEIFSREFRSDRLRGPINFTFSSNDRKIGIFEEERDLIWLIGADGSAMEGFPLRGASMFSIGRLSDDAGWHVIVGGTDRFLYNYKIGITSR
ncbi:MAG: hypothetical protein GX876_06535 [Bacteroidales bacterium]|nr:hypothetical protein [Bacteroidales bacterium]